MNSPLLKEISDEGCLVVRIFRGIGAALFIIAWTACIWALALWDTVIGGKKAGDQDEDLR